MTFTSNVDVFEIAFIRCVTEQGDLHSALKKAAELVCRKYPVSKVYFACKLGRRLHFLTGAGEETYLPARKEKLTDDVFVFVEGGDKLKPWEWQELLTLLRRAVIAWQDRYDKGGKGGERLPWNSG